MKKENVVKILLLTDFSSGYSRDLLSGLVRYARHQKGWAFYRMPLYYRMLHGDKEIIKWAKKWNVDAIVAQMNDIDVKMLSDLNIPIIVQNYKDRIPGVCNLTGDYIGTGRLAADYFIGLGYKSFPIMESANRCGHANVSSAIGRGLRRTGMASRPISSRTEAANHGRRTSSP